MSKNFFICSISGVYMCYRKNGKKVEKKGGGEGGGEEKK